MCSHLFAKMIVLNTSEKTDCSSNPVLLETFPKPISQTFRLPIDYLEESEKHQVSQEVSADLELLKNNTSYLENDDDTESTQPLYHYLFEPKGHFSNNIMPKMAKTFTSNREFLKETQQVILARGVNAEADVGFAEYEEQDVVNVWNDLVYNPEFLEKYGYIEWDSLKHLNQSSTFLQSLSIINGVVPMFNLAMSVLIAILPFFILSYNRQCITLSSYTDCLQQIGGNNQMFCKMISILDPENFNPQNMVIFILMLGLYSYQIYQNVVHTERFFQHVRDVSRHLFIVRQFLEKSQTRLRTFLKQRPAVSSTYSEFYQNAETHLRKSEILYEMLTTIQPPEEITLYRRFSSMGDNFRLYYHLYDDDEAKEVILYFMNLNGYLDLMDAAAQHLHKGNVHFAQLDAKEEKEEDDDNDLEKTEEETKTKDTFANVIIGMYYPRLVKEPREKIVKNDVSFDKHPVLTGPNASGKTTFLKSIAINTLLSQQVGLGFYDEYQMRKLYQHVHSYLNIPDTSERDSLFEAETRRCKTILEKIANSSAEDKHLCIFDELFSGTNPVDASRSAFSFLKYLCHHHPNADFVLTTHYTDVCHKIEELTEPEGRQMVNYKMDVLENPDDHTLTMTYKMVPGISDIKGASHILENMGFPTDIIQEVRGEEKRI